MPPPAAAAVSSVQIALILLCILLLQLPVQSKSVSGTVALREPHTVHHLTQFGCSTGYCTYKLRARLTGPPGAILHRNESASESLVSLSIPIFLDVKWESAELSRLPNCSDLPKSNVNAVVNLPLGGQWSEYKNGGMSQWIRPHVWYYTMEDCQGNISKKIAELAKLPDGAIGPIMIEWQAELLQPDGSHFSYELIGGVWLSVIHIGSYSGILAFLALREVREMKRSGKLHVMIQMLNVVVLSQLASSLLHFGHWLSYYHNGRGLKLLDALADGLTVFSQIVLSSVLIFIAWGYSLNCCTAVGDRIAKLAFPVTSIVALLHLAIVALDKVSADDKSRFHSAAGFIGWTFVVLRLCLYGAFIAGWDSTSSSPSLPAQVAVFLRRFLVAGSLYFLAYPILFFVTNVFAPYLQHRVLNNGIFVMQLLSMMWLSALFLTKGEYFKISELSQSYLPGGYLASKGRHRLD